MSEEREVRQPDDVPAEDYGYDLAHETAADAASSARPRSEGEEPHSRYGGTQSDDDGGDYGYDLAHDVPPQQRRDKSGNR
jgi:hypothetical protein